MIESSKKISLLFVLENLRKAGAQRFLFELIQLLDNNVFDIHVLCGIESKNTRSKVEQEYFWLYHKMGINLHPLIGSKEVGKRFIPLKLQGIIEDRPLLIKMFKKINRAINPYFYRKIYGNRIKKIVNKVDRIAVIDFYSYEIVKDYLTNDQKSNKLDIFLLCHFQQFPLMYSSFEKEIAFNFFYFDLEQKNEALCNSLGRSSYTYQPLLFDINAASHPINIKSSESNVLNIGVFTRLSGYDKPIDAFILAFHSLLVITSANIVLNIVGENVLDVKYYNHLKNLIRFHGIEDNVKFHGHQSDMALFLEANHIDMAWQHSAGSTLGYASLELIVLGVPVLAFSIYENNNNNIDESVSFTIPELIDRTKLYLFDDHRREEYLARQLDKILEVNASERYKEYWNTYFFSKIQGSEYSFR